MASIAKRPDGKYRARYRDAEGRQHAKHFARKLDAQRWLDEQTAALVTGNWVSPATARMTMGEWCDIWLQGYGSRRPSTVRQAKYHVGVIKAAFGKSRVGAIRPSEVNTWTAQMSETRADSTVYSIYRRLSTILTDAVTDGIIPRSPCNKDNAPSQGEQRSYVIETEDVWALYDAVPEWHRPAVLLGAFVGLRVSEAVALRVSDINFPRGIVFPVVQYGGKPLKTKSSKAPVPIPQELSQQLSAYVAAYHGTTMVTDVDGKPTSPSAIGRSIRAARKVVPSLPPEFRFHDLRHYYASLLISEGLDIKTVQARLRHGSVTTTLKTYGHLFKDTEEVTRSVVGGVFRARGITAATGAEQALGD